MAATFTATTQPREEILAPISEFVSSEGNLAALAFPVSLLGQWGLSAIPDSTRVEVLIHEYPTWLWGAEGEVGPHDGGWEQSDRGFGFAASTAESTGASVVQDHWIPTVTARLRELAVMPPGWDGHGGHPPKLAFISQAIAFLAREMGPRTAPPSIVPTSDGGLQLEWHRSGLDVEILFSPEEDPILYLHERDTGKEHEVPPAGAFDEFDLGMRLAS